MMNCQRPMGIMQKLLLNILANCSDVAYVSCYLKLRKVVKSKDKAEISNERKVVSISKKKGMKTDATISIAIEYKQAPIFQLGTTVILLCQLSMEENKQHKKTSSTDKLNILSDLTERECEIYYDDTAESGTVILRMI